MQFEWFKSFSKQNQIVTEIVKGIFLLIKTLKNNEHKYPPTDSEELHSWVF